MPITEIYIVFNATFCVIPKEALKNIQNLHSDENLHAASVKLVWNIKIQEWTRKFKK